jgi:hypothetical protein
MKVLYTPSTGGFASSFLLRRKDVAAFPTDGIKKREEMSFCIDVTTDVVAVNPQFPPTRISVVLVAPFFPFFFFFAFDRYIIDSESLDRKSLRQQEKVRVEVFVRRVLTPPEEKIDRQQEKYKYLYSEDIIRRTDISPQIAKVAWE